MTRLIYCLPLSPFENFWIRATAKQSLPPTKIQTITYRPLYNITFTKAFRGGPNVRK